ncbi:MAG TPA: class I SAM-dependent methyltransferase [Gemmatimonadales bacterium]|nr:class I SAM-dependent methyltransferase [Gemmatimonadales bacterium]
MFRCRRHSDTRSQFLLALARAVARAPRDPAAPPFLEIGTRSGGSALLTLRVLADVYRHAPHRPLVLTVDPYGARPYEGAPFTYDDRHYVAMKRALARYPNHIHYMMDSTLFLAELDRLYLWIGGRRQPLERFTLAYLDGSHDPDVVWHEIEALVPRIVPGGSLVVDDTDWFGGEVRRRLDRAALAGGLRVRHHGKQSVVEASGPRAPNGV